MSNPDWTVTWDRPEDSHATWNGGRDLVLPLQQSLSLYYYQGWARAWREVAVAGGLRACFVNGYEYRLWEWQPRQAWPAIEALLIQRERAVPDRWANEWLPQIRADLAHWQQVALPDLADDELAAHLHNLLTRQLEHWYIHAIMGDAPLSAVGRLVDWYLQRFPQAPESEPYRLLQGQPNTSTLANQQLWQLGEAAKREQLVATLATQFDEPLILPAEFQVQLRAYYQEFGIVTPEQQQRALLLISHYGAQELPNPADEQAHLAQEREEWTASVRQKLAGEELAHFDNLLACALANHPLTESHNLYLDQMSDAATKRVIDEFAQRLLRQGILAARAEIDYLTVYELLQWGQGLRNPLRPAIQARQAEYQRYRQLTPPPFVGQPPTPNANERADRFGGPAAPLTAEPGTLRGIGAAPGVAAGRVLVAHTLDEALALQLGEILVCRHTDPSWTPLFALAGGLVTDFGGSLSHAAVVAREYRLPAVVGTHIATQQLVTGQRVQVDGLQGLVTLESPR